MREPGTRRHARIVSTRSAQLITGWCARGGGTAAHTLARDLCAGVRARAGERASEGGASGCSHPAAERMMSHGGS
eukprot:3185043-Prymnesium_polylepis.1